MVKYRGTLERPPLFWIWMHCLHQPNMASSTKEVQKATSNDRKPICPMRRPDVGARYRHSRLGIRNCMAREKKGTDERKA